jgi:hypothetical protein
VNHDATRRVEPRRSCRKILLHLPLDLHHGVGEAWVISDMECVRPINDQRGDEEWDVVPLSCHRGWWRRWLRCWHLERWVTTPDSLRNNLERAAKNAPE